VTGGTEPPQHRPSLRETGTMLVILAVVGALLGLAVGPDKTTAASYGAVSGVIPVIVIALALQTRFLTSPPSAFPLRRPPRQHRFPTHRPLTWLWQTQRWIDRRYSPRQVAVGMATTIVVLLLLAELGMLAMVAEPHAVPALVGRP
jgi:hypothetical protein